MQDEGSQCVVLACEARAGFRVLDLCAGNGGKSLALAALVGSEGHVLAHDVVASRLAALRASAQRAHVAERIDTVETSGATPAAADPDRAHPDRAHPDRSHPDRAAAEAAVDTRLLDASRRHAQGGHDIVLVDAPCSSSGALRRHPGLRWSGQWASHPTAASTARRALPVLQRRLLRQGAALTRAGGALVYATCALDARENQDVAAAFEAEFAASGGRRLEPWPFAEGVPGRHEEGTSTHYRTIWPHRHGAHAIPDGFFIARWRILE